VMNPKPFASLNHFTVPVAMSLLFLFSAKTLCLARANAFGRTQVLS